MCNLLFMLQNNLVTQFPHHPPVTVNVSPSAIPQDELLGWTNKNSSPPTISDVALWDQSLTWDCLSSKSCITTDGTTTEGSNQEEDVGFGRGCPDISIVSCHPTTRVDVIPASYAAWLYQYLMV